MVPLLLITVRRHVILDSCLTNMFISKGILLMGKVLSRKRALRSTRRRHMVNWGSLALMTMELLHLIVKRCRPLWIRRRERSRVRKRKNSRPLAILHLLLQTRRILRRKPIGTRILLLRVLIRKLRPLILLGRLVNTVVISQLKLINIRLLMVTYRRISRRIAWKVILPLILNRWTIGKELRHRIHRALSLVRYKSRLRLRFLNRKFTWLIQKS